jgi:hypothetical protein
VDPRERRAAALVLTSLMTLALTSCVCVGEKVDLVDLRTETSSVDLNGAESVVVDVEMGVGELVVRSGSSTLMNAEFTYNVEEWKPVVKYEVKNGKGWLSITQPDAEGKSTPSGAKNTWDLTFSENVELELNIDLGVGEARLDLGDLMLTDLSVDHGVGDLNVDLDGTHVGELRATIDGGVGSISLVVPSSIGVRVDAETGIGSFRTHGFSKQSGALVNDAYGKTDETIRVSIDAGIGEVTVDTSDAAMQM